MDLKTSRFILSFFFSSDSVEFNDQKEDILTHNSDKKFFFLSKSVDIFSALDKIYTIGYFCTVLAIIIHPFLMRTNRLMSQLPFFPLNGGTFLCCRLVIYQLTKDILKAVTFGKRD